MEDANNEVYQFDNVFLSSLQRMIVEYDLQRMSVNMRKVFFDYMRYQTVGLDVDFDDILNDIERLMEMIDFLQEQKQYIPCPTT